jgi:hypothetical protein
MIRRRPAFSFFIANVVLALGISSSFAQNPIRTPAQSIRGAFSNVNKKVLDMAKDFPEDNYGYRLKPEMRSFGELIVHVASGNVYAAKAGRGEKASWDELEPKDYPTKASIVGLMERSVTDSEAALKAVPDDSFAKTLQPWIGVIEHSAEHYGLLVAYYRANGLVPPESRPKK